MAILTRARIAAVALALLSFGASAQERLDPQSAFAKSEGAIGRKLGPYELTDSTGARFSLSQYAGRPLVVSLIYTACASVCPPTTQHLRKAIDEARRSIGADRFSVLTVSFDAKHDTPARMAAFRRMQDAEAEDWRFATGDPATISALLQDLGFSYANIAGGFDHVTQTTVVGSDGKVYRHVYGDDFPLPVFIETVKEAVYGIVTSSFTIQGLADRIRFLCTVYDANVGHYRTSYAIFIGITVGALSLLLSGWVVAAAWKGSRRPAQTPTETTGAST